VRAAKSLSFLPSGRERGLGPWRRLAIEVNERRIRTYWDGQLAHEVSSERLNAHMKSWLATQPQLDGKGIRFDARGGLGLLVDEGSAVFSNAVVEPLTTDE
jgi:hypothetical protein